MNDQKTLSDIMRERRNQVQGLDRYQIAAAMASQSPDAIAQGLTGLQQQANPFNVGASNFLGQKAQDIYSKRMGDVKGSILRNAVFADAERDAGTTALAQAEALHQKQLELERAAARARKKKKKRGFASALGGVVGAVGGGLIGGPTGAYIGSGLGQQLGGSLG